MGLNQAQKKAAAHGRGPCLVLAGPGSGKTLTVVSRIKYLMEVFGKEESLRRIRLGIDKLS